MASPAMSDARAYGGIERRRNHILVTRNREYHCRDNRCVAVRDRGSRMFIRNHLAIGKRLTGAMRFGRDGGVEDVSPPEALVRGEQLCFSAGDGQLENDVITSPLESIERPPKGLVAAYEQLSA